VGLWVVDAEAVVLAVLVGDCTVDAGDELVVDDDGADDELWVADDVTDGLSVLVGDDEVLGVDDGRPEVGADVGL